MVEKLRKRADLHTHTSFSDGDLTPRELLRRASLAGVSVISITDHDTMGAYSPENFEYAQSLGLLLVPGIEISSTDSETGDTVHVLGLNVQPTNSSIRGLCSTLRQVRIEYLLLAHEFMATLGLRVRYQELIESGTSVTKAHIARDIMNNPENKRSLERLYADGKPTQGRFIEDWLLPDKIGTTSTSHSRVSTAEAVAIVQEAEGLAFCAHPSFNVMRGLSLSAMHNLILKNRFDGVEVYNIQYNKSDGDSEFNMVSSFRDFARRNGLRISGGSDFHSDDSELWGNNVDIGLINTPYLFDQAQAHEALK